MGASTDLFAAMDEFFQACYLALADTPGGQPECAYICEGPPSWDTCPCLVVHAGGPRIADTFPLQPSLAPMHRATVQGQVNLLTLTATILRCSPQISEDGSTLPTPAAHAVAARETSADLWAIWNHLLQMKRLETLFPPKDREFTIDPAVAVNTQGGCAGWQITIQTALGGYRPGE